MTPGGTSSGTVVLPSTNLQFKRTSAGSATYTVIAIHTAASDTGCPVAETYTLATVTMVANTTVAVNVSLPYGAWTIQVKNGASVRASEAITLSPSPITTVWPVTPAILQFSS